MYLFKTYTTLRYEIDHLSLSNTFNQVEKFNLYSRTNFIFLFFISAPKCNLFSQVTYYRKEDIFVQELNLQLSTGTKK
jgi:hypothetical protein